MNYAQKPFGIKAWSDDEKPREKFIQKGRQNLSNVELLAILIGSGTRKKSAVALSRDLMEGVGNSLASLSRMSISELMKVSGIGKAKAISILSSMELGRRRQLEVGPSKLKIISSEDAYKLARPLLQDLAIEEFWIFLLNRSNKLISKIRISSGGVAGTVVDAKLIFKPALEVLASSIILIHNHPSGNLKPSQSDIDLTRKIREAGMYLDIAVLDHLIITDSGYFSLADEGLI